MRLINCLTMQLEEFFGNEIPAYAILSHTWEEQEITYQDFLAGVTSKKGWIKIKQICGRAREGKYLYAWIDTCCIDKSSSVELTEAINSMYEWYKKSAICYVFLSDLKKGGELYSCRWFTRGWTLQELIASPRIDFLDSLWQYYGSKQKMGHILSKITMVDIAVLGSSGSDLRYMLDSIPVCRRMSWLSRRQTTRVEDIAYCGLGIFDVNMPLLYGEGARAFIRLQEEIIRRRNDFTILAWRNQPEGRAGVLAPHPRHFEEATDIEPSQSMIYNPTFTLTNKGLQFKVPEPIQRAGETPELVLDLYCFSGSKQESGIALPLKNLGGDVYDRSHYYESKEKIKSEFAQPYGSDLNRPLRTIFLVVETSQIQSGLQYSPGYDFSFRHDSNSLDLLSTNPEKRWRNHHTMREVGIFRARDTHNFIGLNIYQFRFGQYAMKFAVAVGFGLKEHPWVSCASEIRQTESKSWRQGLRYRKDQAAHEAHDALWIAAQNQDMVRMRTPGQTRWEQHFSVTFEHQLEFYRCVQEIKVQIVKVHHHRSVEVEVKSDIFSTTGRLPSLILDRTFPLTDERYLPAYRSD